MVVPLSSAAGIISLLDEPQEELKVYALAKLDAVVDLFWAEISDAVSKIEMLFEDPSFKHRELAALVASKVYYHLGELDESMGFALGAGKLFDPNVHSEFVDTIISKSIDKYIELRVERQEHPSNQVTIDPRLEDIVLRMVQRCYNSKEYRQVIGIALESFRLDMLEEAILKSDNVPELLTYVFHANTTTVENLAFRVEIFRLLVKLYSNLAAPDYIAISQCLVHVNDPAEIAKLLVKLIGGSETMIVTAYQIAFDVEENATQEFILKSLAALPVPPATAASAAPDAAKDPNAMETDEATPLLASAPSSSAQPASESPLSRIRKILSGDLSIKLNLDFLYRNNHTDLQILKNTKNAFDSRVSVFHVALTFSNAFMNAGTTSDEFLRLNLEWLSRATNWTKFSATAALGVIHKGQINQSMALLQPYLPRNGVSGSPYSEGGALYALGLINANHGTDVLPYLANALKETQNEVIQHGAALGLGVAGMATGNDEIYEDLKALLFNDNAVAGEAAGIAMGLIMLGTASPKAIEEMLQYAHETQHEKIIRGLALGLSLIMFGREESADAFIEQLLSEKDPILRYGGMYTIALAYAGTGNNKAIRKLLHVAVSDVSEDVRRVAVMALGFVLYKSPEQVPRVVQLLSESFNPHVRYGAALALGISCAGTNLQEAIAILEPMAKDSVDFVRQGAVISLAMILIQHNETSSTKVASTRTLIAEMIGNKREEVMSRFGAALAQGILDAGGRNVTLSLQTRSGFPNIPAIVGTALFSYFWYWFPMAHLLSLAFTPTGMIGLNKDLQIPKFEFVSNAKPSLFAYVPPLPPPATEKVEKIATAVLSTTAKVMARAKKAEKGKGKDGTGAGSVTAATPDAGAAALSPAVDAMDTDDKKNDKESGDADDESKAAADAPTTAASTASPKKKKKEPTSEILQNFSRVLPAQVKYVLFTEGSRYVPVKKESIGGIVMLTDSRPGEPEELLSISVPAVGGSNNAASTSSAAATANQGAGANNAGVSPSSEA